MRLLIGMAIDLATIAVCIVALVLLLETALDPALVVTLAFVVGGLQEWIVSRPLRDHFL